MKSAKRCKRQTSVIYQSVFLQELNSIMSLDQSMDEALAVSIWDGSQVGSLVGPNRSKRKEKQFARLVEHQLKLSAEQGWPMSRVLAGLGAQSSVESKTEVVTTWREWNSICNAIPQGRCRVVFDTKGS